MTERVSERKNEQRKQCGTSKWVSGASKQANGRMSGPVLASGFFVVLEHSAMQMYANLAFI